MGVGKDALLLINSFLIFCREKPKISAISDIPTKSGVASINLASGITLFTSSIALHTAVNAFSASLLKMSPIRPCCPTPIKASSQPSLPKRSTNDSGFIEISEKLNFKVNSYSFIFYASFSSTLRPVQLSTTLLICFPCEPAFLGVLQILEIQNSPQRHSILLYGQYILPQAWEPAGLTTQPCAFRIPKCIFNFRL
ncbi:hypothetical protein BMETH_1299_0 [methanotrophic bacterial endosymbiont of Bathymodiolus sp.]|nr:hypothetical protein BMETH_1299_0 [methanotrophic bacterial endosymbiont of Bathymodiolus sp.]